MRKVGTMPDTQFATDVKPLGASFATMTREAVASTITGQPPAGVAVPSGASAKPDQTELIRQQQRMIQRSYSRIAADDQTRQRGREMVYRISKRVLDISISLPAFLVFAPLMLVLIVLIRMDSPGPAIFKQQRVGKRGKLFRMYKFRSMTQDAGVQLTGVHKSEYDQRVTRVGRFIRKTSLDELPQLVNVLLGQMSLVGPRPELPEIVLQRYEPWQYRRLSVDQGITGWWQVTGRGKKLLWKHTADDLYYVDRASLLFDVKLLVMTVTAVLKRDGAF